MTSNHPRPWWLNDALSVGPEGLALDSVSLRSLAAHHGTPLYVYSRATILRRVSELRTALSSMGLPFRIHFAMKSNRHGPVLELLRAEQNIAIDACSPAEVALALRVGFRPDEISVTAGMLSNRDLAALEQHRVHLNLDTRSALRRLASRPEPARNIGLRIDPGVRVGWGDEPKLSYGDSKFGFHFDDVLNAATFAASLGHTVDTLHFHAGWGLQSTVAQPFAHVLDRVALLARAIPSVHTINVGGGLTWSYREEDHPLPVSQWAEMLHHCFGKTHYTIACEPGTFVTASAGVLLCEVNTVETRHNGVWVGLDAGHNVNCFASHYNIPMAIIPLEDSLETASHRVSVAGNINEANDVFARAILLPPLDEGDLVALYPAGAYGASMASNHCMRGLPNELLI